MPQISYMISIFQKYLISNFSWKTKKAHIIPMYKFLCQAKIFQALSLEWFTSSVKKMGNSLTFSIIRHWKITILGKENKHVLKINL